jgi:hypothetical protein
VQQLLSALSATHYSKRSSVIAKEMKRLLDTRAVRRRMRVFRLYAPWLVSSSLTLIIYSVTSAIMVDRLGIRYAWPLVVLVLVVFFYSIWTYSRAYSAVWPRESPPWRHIIPMILAPPATARVMAALSRELFSEYHWLPVVKVGMEPDIARELTYQYWRQLVFPAVWEQLDCSTAQSVQREWQNNVFRFISENYGNPQEALCPPIQVPDCTAYCPRCRQQYANAVLCSDCGILLSTFASTDLN